MGLPSIAGVTKALGEIRPYHPETPLVRAELLSKAIGADVWIKNETVTPIGCFKLRGALSDVLRARGNQSSIKQLVTSSTGNHGQAVAYAGRLLGIPVTVFLPERSNPVKALMIEALGAAIRSAGSDSYAAKLIAKDYAEKGGYHFVDDGNSVDVAEGAGTVGLEIAQRLEAIDAIFIPVGDAALVNGSACALKAYQSAVQIVGVQASQAPALAESRRRGEIVEIVPDTIADGLATRAPTHAALAGMLAFVDRFVLVEETELLAAINTLAVAGHILAEPSAAASLAAAWRDRGAWPGKRIVLVVTGANIEGGILKRALNTPPLWPPQVGQQSENDQA